MLRFARGNWRLLVVCGALNAAIAGVYVAMFVSAAGSALTNWPRMIAIAGELGIVAGLCAIAAGVLAPERRMRMLAVNGAALATMGFIQVALARRAVSILVFAVLVSAMAITLGIVEIRVARRTGVGRLYTAAGVVLVSFTLPSAAFGLRWIPLRPNSHPDLIWLATYFGFAALCLFGLSLRNRPGAVGAART